MDNIVNPRLENVHDLKQKICKNVHGVESYMVFKFEDHDYYHLSLLIHIDNDSETMKFDLKFGLKYISLTST